METKKPESNLNRGKTRLLKLDDITILDELQSRAEGLNADVVAEYVERFESLRGVGPVPEGANEIAHVAATDWYDATGMPRLSVVTADYDTFWLASGFHRFEALTRIDCKTDIPVEVFEGDLTDAKYISMTANRDHGLRRSNADKRRAVRLALEHEWTYQLSNRAIAEEVGVSEAFIRNMRDELSAEENRLNEESKPGAHGAHLKEKKNNKQSTAHGAQLKEEPENPFLPSKRKGKDGKSYPVRRPAESVPDAGADDIAFAQRLERRKARSNKRFEAPPEKAAKTPRKKTVAKSPSHISIDVPLDCEYTAWNVLVDKLGAEYMRKILSVRPETYK